MTPTLLAQIDGLRAQTLGLLERLADLALRFEFPSPPEALVLYRQKLQDNHYRVLVVGEAKRGKSCFINALIGRAILPTDVDIATSQVFLISKADQEAYRLRFEDDSTQDIAVTDLPRFGSQVLADVAGTPRLDQLIRWIEVDAPARFLPDGVSLLDTPGLGSLYAAHSQITQRFIPQADAVIYVLDSGQPIGQADLETLAAILEATPSLFFIQTRIDQFRKEQWQALQVRNEQVLHERFADTLTDTRVWPISSTNLLTAAETHDPDYELVSRHRELAAALKTFLFRVAGLTRLAAAMTAAAHFHHTARQVLLGRLADLTEQSKERRQQTRQELAERKARFDRDWGERGAKRQALLAALQQATTAAHQTFRQALESGGQIERTIRTRIDRVTSIDEAARLAEGLAGEVTRLAVEQWQAVDQQLRRYALEQLQPFMDSLEDLAGSSATETPGAALDQDRYGLDIQDDWFERAKGGFIDFRNASGMSVVIGSGVYYGLSLASASSPIGALVASTAFPPIAIGAALIAGVWALYQGYQGWQRTSTTQVKRAQQELYKHLGEVRDRVRRYYFDVDLSAGRHQGLAEAHFDRFQQALGAHLQRLATVRSEESRQELARLTEQAKLDEQQRASRLVELRGWLAQWDQVGQDLQPIGQALTAIDQTLQAQHTPQPQDQPT